jgi:hypothetical protein
MSTSKVRTLRQVTVADVDALYAKRADELHRKVDQTRDAYFGFIFPITKTDLMAVSSALGLERDAASQLFKLGRAFSTFRASSAKLGGLTNHITGAALLALRHPSLDTGLAAVTDSTLAKFVSEHEDSIVEITEARASWFGRIFFPAQAFCNAMNVFGAKVSPEVLFNIADKHDFAALAGERQTIRGDFGIAVWLTLLGKA